MKQFSLTYPALKELPETRIVEFVAKQGWYNREILGRINKGRLSSGDLDRAGIKFRAIDIKRLLQYSLEFKDNPILTYKQDRGLVFEGEQQRFNILLEAVGIKQGKLKDGDTINLSGFKPKGQIPVLKEYVT